MLNEVKHLAIEREILRCAQNDTIHHLRRDRAVVCFVKGIQQPLSMENKKVTNK